MGTKHVMQQNSLQNIVWNTDFQDKSEYTRGVGAPMAGKLMSQQKRQSCL